MKHNNHNQANPRMNMLLRELTFVELEEILERKKAFSSAPYLVDPNAINRARKTAKKQGLWTRIGQELDPSREIPVIKRSTFRQYVRNGNRVPHQNAESARGNQLQLATLAVWLDHPKADLDYLQDILWAYCDDWTWVMAAHEYGSIDLGSAMHGARFAEILYALQDKIEPEVAERLHSEIERRIFRNAVDYDNTEFWHTARMNWNHVCNGALIRAALLEIENNRKLARLIHPAIQNMTYALDGFTDDGGCEEGTGYWGFGFGNYVEAAYALHLRTGGELNIMADEKVERICRYPLATHIHGAFRANFADCGDGAVAFLNALQINHFYDLPELYELCPRRSGKVEGKGDLAVRDMTSLALYSGERANGKSDSKDYELSDLGMVKLRGKTGKDQVTVVALAGNNGVPHNHNDIGSFIVHKHKHIVLADPGCPLYNYETFREKRYDILWCRSLGHSVPLINDREQEAGAKYYGELTVEGLNKDGVKKAIIDMSKAYPKGTVKKLVRTFQLDSSTNNLTISDSYEFSKKPKALEEAFVTFEKVTLAKNGKSLRIGPVRGGVTMSTDQAGKFKVETMKEEAKHTPPGRLPLQRIIYVPKTFSKVFELRFNIS